MKHLLISNLFVLFLSTSFGQSLVQIGDRAPNYFFTKMVNAPNSELKLTDLKETPVILAFWGTWCSPCIPEMINLGKLQKQFGNKIRIIGVSNDNEQKLKYFLQKRPSKIWFASDLSNNLWNIFNLQTAGHAVLIDKNNVVVGITETQKIDSTIIKNLIQSESLNLSEDRGTKNLDDNQEPIKLDSSTIYSFVIQSEIKGVTPMMRKPPNGAFAKRRITIINLVPNVILQDAFNVSTEQRIFYADIQDSLVSFQNPVCIDFIVSDTDKNNLQTLFQKELNLHLPVKGKIEKRLIDCYVLKPINDNQILIKQSSKSNNEYSFDGLSFQGTGILIKTFVDYIENELQYPVYDSTGLTKYYDINFSRNNVEPLQSTKDGLKKLGFELVKDKKEMEVLLILK